MEGLGQLKNTMTSSGIEPMTFWLVAQCLNKFKYNINKLHYCMPQLKVKKSIHVIGCGGP
jgi:hypothetical protein